MKINFYLFILVLITLVSCDKDVVVDKENISFTFSRDINKSSYDSLTTNIILQIKELNFSELNSIKRFKIDTILYSYVFYIPFTDTLTDNTIDRFKGFAAILSDYKLGGQSIHIKLTDNSFNPIKGIQFNRNAYEIIADHFISKSISIEIEKSAPSFQSGGLDIILRNKIPGLFNGQDTLFVKVKMENEDIKIDMTANLDKISPETVKEEFKKIDPLYFYGLFDNRTIYFQLRDKSGQLRAVYGIPKM